jgi:hypothetical protein
MTNMGHMAEAFCCRCYGQQFTTMLLDSAYFESRTGLGPGPGLGLEENPD